MPSRRDACVYSNMGRGSRQVRVLPVCPQGPCSLPQALEVGVIWMWVTSQLCWGSHRAWGRWPGWSWVGVGCKTHLGAPPLVWSSSKLTQCHGHTMPVPCLAISLPSPNPSTCIPARPLPSNLSMPVPSTGPSQVNPSPQFWWADPGKQPSTHNPWLREKVAEKSPIIYPHGSNTGVGTGATNRKTLHMARDL